MTVSAHVAAFLSSLKALAVWIIERLQQRPRRPHYTMRMAALNALVRAIWRQLASQIEYAFSVGEWVFAPVRVAYRNRGEMIVTARVPARITQRWHESGVNWYYVHNHPWALKEDELSKYERVITVNFTGVTTAAA